MEKNINIPSSPEKRPSSINKEVSLREILTHKRFVSNHTTSPLRISSSITTTSPLRSTLKRHQSCEIQHFTPPSGSPIANDNFLSTRFSSQEDILCVPHNTPVGSPAILNINNDAIDITDNNDFDTLLLE